jgi:hypothetical protein
MPGLLEELNRDVWHPFVSLTVTPATGRPRTRYGAEIDDVARFIG